MFAGYTFLILYETDDHENFIRQNNRLTHHTREFFGEHENFICK